MTGVKKCIQYEVERVRPRSKPKETCCEVKEKDHQARQLCKADAMACEK